MKLYKRSRTYLDFRDVGYRRRPFQMIKDVERDYPEIEIFFFSLCVMN
jgi:hypothetical protein